MNFSKILIIIPTYNEAENIEAMISTLCDQYLGINILIVDDTSPDKTYEIVEKIMKENKNVFLLKKSGKEGLGRAYVDGMKWAMERDQYSNILTMDCDFSHDPSDVISLLSHVDSNQLVIGSRYVNKSVRIVNWPIKRLILSKLAAIYSRFWTMMPITDPTGGFTCYDVKTLKNIAIDSIRSNGYCFQVEMKFKMFKQDIHFCEVPITFTERENGKSKMNKSIVYEAILKIPFLRFKA